jgi:hypothetical protein
VLLVAHVSRCPACGFLLASAPGPVYQNSLPPKRPRPVSGARSTLATTVALSGVGVTAAIVVVGFWLVRQRDNERAALPAASAVASASAAPTPAAAPVVLEPTALFAQAKSAALAWHTDAALIDIDITPVTLGKVDPGGKLIFTFGKPAGRKLGPGTPVQGAGFVVTADASGVQGEERATSKAVSVAEPNCIFEDVLIKIDKTGISRGEKLHLHYGMSEKSARGVWRVSRAGESEILRTLDGANCAIIVH